MNRKSGAANTGTTKLILILGIVVIAALAIYMLSGMPDRRSTGDRVGDAINGLSHGVGEAGSRLGDESPAQKLGDKVQDNK